MTGQIYRKCERCKQLYEVAYNYEPIKMPDRDKASKTFISRDDIYNLYDLCFPCLEEFWKRWELFMTSAPIDIEETKDYLDTQ